MGDALLQELTGLHALIGRLAPHQTQFLRPHRVSIAARVEPQDGSDFASTNTASANRMVYHLATAWLGLLP
jgi:hypothetical protein